MIAEPTIDAELGVDLPGGRVAVHHPRPRHRPGVLGRRREPADARRAAAVRGRRAARPRRRRHRRRRRRRATPSAASSPPPSSAPGSGSRCCGARPASPGSRRRSSSARRRRSRAARSRARPILSIAFIGGFYALTTWALSNAWGVDAIGRQTAIDRPADFIFAATDEYVGSALVVDACRSWWSTSFLAMLLGFHNLFARYVFALGRAGMLPAAAGVADERTGTPRRAALAIGVVQLVVIGGFVIFGRRPATRRCTPGSSHWARSRCSSCSR